jgi:DNA/RNA endonuclease YhcR with UshA esterase domain
MTKTKNTLNYSANDVWAVACKAQRLNKEYIKFVPEESKKETNREIMYRLLEEGPKHLTVADKNAGVKVRQHFQALTFRLLTDAHMSDFEKTAMAIADKDIIDSKLDIAIIASLPQSFERANIRKDQDMEIAKVTTDKTIGQIKNRVELTVTVLRTFLSHKWNCYFITAVTDNEEVVFFGSPKIVTKVGDVLNIKGTVKSYRKDDNGMVTQLNRVLQVT